MPRIIDEDPNFECTADVETGDRLLYLTHPTHGVFVLKSDETLGYASVYRTPDTCVMILEYPEERKWLIQPVRPEQHDDIVEWVRKSGNPVRTRPGPNSESDQVAMLNLDLVEGIFGDDGVQWKSGSFSRIDIDLFRDLIPADKLHKEEERCHLKFESATSL